MGCTHRAPSSDPAAGPTTKSTSRPKRDIEGTALPSSPRTACLFRRSTSVLDAQSAVREHAIALEKGQAELAASEREQRQVHQHKVVALQDNRPTACSHHKSRSSSYPLNRLIRKRAARLLATWVRLFLPWIQSHLMPADALSRDLSLLYGGRRAPPTTWD